MTIQHAQVPRSVFDPAVSVSGPSFDLQSKIMTKFQEVVAQSRRFTTPGAVRAVPDFGSEIVDPLSVPTYEIVLPLSRVTAEAILGLVDLVDERVLVDEIQVPIRIDDEDVSSGTEATLRKLRVAVTRPDVARIQVARSDVAVVKAVVGLTVLHSADGVRLRQGGIFFSSPIVVSHPVKIPIPILARPFITVPVSLRRSTPVFWHHPDASPMLTISQSPRMSQVHIVMGFIEGSLQYVVSLSIGVGSGGRHRVPFTSFHDGHTVLGLFHQS